MVVCSGDAEKMALRSFEVGYYILETPGLVVVNLLPSLKSGHTLSQPSPRRGLQRLWPQQLCPGYH